MAHNPPSGNTASDCIGVGRKEFAAVQQTAEGASRAALQKDLYPHCQAAKNICYIQGLEPNIVSMDPDPAQLEKKSGSDSGSDLKMK